MDTNKILKENEIEANRVLTTIVLVTLGIVAITWLLFETGFFYIRVQFRGLMILIFCFLPRLPSSLGFSNMKKNGLNIF